MKRKVSSIYLNKISNFPINLLRNRRIFDEKSFTSLKYATFQWRGNDFYFLATMAAVALLVICECLLDGWSNMAVSILMEVISGLIWSSWLTTSPIWAATLHPVLLSVSILMMVYFTLLQLWPDLPL